MWKYFQQYADRLGSAIGTPRIMCIMGRKVLAHPSGTGTSSIHDYNRSSACLKSGKINRYDGRAGSPLGIDILTQLQKGLKLEIGVVLSIWPHQQDSISMISENTF